MTRWIGLCRRVGVTFRDREDAGRRLGERLRAERLDDPVVLGLPRGGVAVAAAVAKALGAPLDIVVARKLGVPWQPELAFGAIAPGVVVLRQDVIQATGIGRAQTDAVIERETARLDDLARAYRGDRPPIALDGRTAVIVDDGLATGATATAAARSVRRARPAQLLVAVPVCAHDTAVALGREVDAVVCLRDIVDFRAVGLHYVDFGQVGDAEVRALLGR